MSNIEWTNITANPIHLIREDGSHGGHWCHKVSSGCGKCYSETQNQSNYFKFASHLPYSGSAPDNLIFDEKVMQELIKVRSPKKVFLGSMTDLFGEWVPDTWLDRALAYMALAKQHTFQILTKRPERMPKYFLSPNRSQAIFDFMLYYTTDPKNQHNLSIDLPIQNVWLGTSTENQATADDRIPSLLEAPAAVRFLSCEPLLESIDIRDYLQLGIDWVIVGGESGTGARPCHIDWIRSIVRQCKQSETAVFVKQLGSTPIESNPYIKGIAESHRVIRLKDRKGGDINEFPEDLRVREFPQ